MPLAWVVTVPEPPAAFITESAVSRALIAAPECPSALEVATGLLLDLRGVDECELEQSAIAPPTANAAGRHPKRWLSTYAIRSTSQFESRNATGVPDWECGSSTTTPRTIGKTDWIKHRVTITESAGARHTKHPHFPELAEIAGPAAAS